MTITVTVTVTVTVTITVTITITTTLFMCQCTVYFSHYKLIENTYKIIKKERCLHIHNHHKIL